jgi:hypothetical protein
MSETEIDSPEAEDCPAEEQVIHSGGKRQGNMDDRSDAAKKLRLTCQTLDDIIESEGESPEQKCGAAGVLLPEGRHL